MLDTIKKITSIACDLKKLLTKQKQPIEDIDSYKQKIINEEFYKKLDNKNKSIEFCDCVRKEKQKMIEELK